MSKLPVDERVVETVAQAIAPAIATDAPIESVARAAITAYVGAVADPVEGTNPGDAERVGDGEIDAWSLTEIADRIESHFPLYADRLRGEARASAVAPALVSGDERLREERDRLADALYSAHEFVQGVRDWTGENPEERDELLAMMDAALASLSVSSPEREGER